MYPLPTRILLLLLSFSSLVAAVNFLECLELFKNGDPNAIGGVNSRGQPVSPAEAVGFTYEACTRQCGTGAESPQSYDFVRSFSSWLLPWLALLGQLPFGSPNPADVFLSIIISVGSPALAAYSLALTSITTRSVYRRARRVRHGSRAAVAAALISLQQIPLELTEDERLLASIPITNSWSQEIGDRLSRRGTWSLAIVKYVAWVVITFAFALVDSFMFGSYEGHATAILWLWLLCLAIGWLWVPTFTRSELRSVPRSSNQRSVKRATTAVRRATTADGPRIPKGRKRFVIDPVPEVNEENEKVKVESIQEDAKREEIDQKASPLSNPTYHQSTTSFRSPPEIQQGHDHLAISVSPNANQSAVSRTRSPKPSVNPETDELFVPQKLTLLNRDEHRLTATFNYSRIMRYLVLVNDVLTVLDKLTGEEDENSSAPVATTPPAEKKVVFPPGAFTSMFGAAAMALILQGGITAAAVIVLIPIPPLGLDCRSLGYIIYGATGIFIVSLTITSTILARISETRERPTVVKRFTAFIAITLRNISFLLAFTNRIGFIVFHCLQFSNFLDNCYCLANVIGRGTDSYMVYTYEGWISKIRNLHIVATVLAAFFVFVYMVSLWVMSVPPDYS